MQKREATKGVDGVTYEPDELWDYDRDRPAGPSPSPARCAVYFVVVSFWGALTFAVWSAETSPTAVAILTWLCFACCCFCCWLVSQA